MVLDFKLNRSKNLYYDHQSAGSFLAAAKAANSAFLASHSSVGFGSS